MQSTLLPTSTTANGPPQSTFAPAEVRRERRTHVVADLGAGDQHAVGTRDDGDALVVVDVRQLHPVGQLRPGDGERAGDGHPLAELAVVRARRPGLVACLSEQRGLALDEVGLDGCVVVPRAFATPGEEQQPGRRATGRPGASSRLLRWRAALAGHLGPGDGLALRVHVDPRLLGGGRRLRGSGRCRIGTADGGRRGTVHAGADCLLRSGPQPEVQPEEPRRTPKATNSASVTVTDAAVERPR